MAALREIASESKAKQEKLLVAKAEWDSLDQQLRENLKKEVDEAFDSYRKDQEAKGKPIGTKKEQEKYRERLFDSALKSSSSITAKDRKRYQSLIVEVGSKKKSKGDDVDDSESPKTKERSVFDWSVPFKIQSFDTIDELDKYYQKNLLDIDKSRAHDLNKINHLIDRFEIYKNRADKDLWSYEKIAAYYKTDVSTVNRVMQLRHVENKVKKFVAENEAANLNQSIEHKHRLKLGNIYRHISKAGSSKEAIEVDPKKVSGYPTTGNLKEKNTAAVLEFMKHEALYGKPHPECTYLQKKSKIEDGKLSEVQEDHPSPFDHEAFVVWLTENYTRANKLTPSIGLIRNVMFQNSFLFYDFN